MKKFTLMIIAALMAVTANAQKLERAQLTRPVSAKANMVARTMPGKVKPVKPFKLNSKAHKAAAISSIDDLTGTWMQVYYSYFDKVFMCTMMEITKVEGSRNKITINGWLGGWTEPIEATVDFKELTITIEPQLIYEYEGDVSLELVNVFSETEGAPLVGTIDEDGSINFEDGWGAMLIDGSGYYEAGLYTSLVRPNGKMNYTYNDKEFSDDIYIEVDEEESKAYVFNFGAYGRMIILQLNNDHTVSVPSDQVVYSYVDYDVNEEGEVVAFILYGIGRDGKVPLTGTWTETAITFDQPWTGYTESGVPLDDGNSLCVITFGSEDPTGISQVNAAQQNGGKAFNLAGQQVKQGYKGIVIKDGKKFMVK